MKGGRRTPARKAPRRPASRRRAGAGGFALGWLLKGRLGPLGAVLVIVPLLLIARLYVLATQNPGQAVLVVLVIGLAFILLRGDVRRWRGRPPGWRKGLDSAGWLPRLKFLAGAFVYVLREWRNDRDELLTEEEAEDDPSAVLHLVYIGKTVDIAQRFRQHAEDKPWWHDGLVIEVVPCRDGAAALAEEARRIRRWAKKSVPVHMRPRENRAMNPTYDPAYSAYMLRKALLRRVA